MEEESASLRLVRSRRAARQAALQALYQIEVGHGYREEALEGALSRVPFHSETAAFVRELVLGVLAQRAALDRMIAPLMAEGWNYSRIAVVDRTALRLAAFELEHLPGVPPKVTINEAVELVKVFGSIESSRFVNGVLGRLLPLTAKANWDPSQEAAAEPDADAPEVLVAEAPEEEELLREDDPKADSLLRAGGWVLRTEGNE